MKFIIAIILLVTAIGISIPCCTRNVDDVKANSEAVFKSIGYRVVGYEGYNWSLLCGGNVWYQLRRVDDENRTAFTGYICKWGKEYHIYGPNAVDAIKSN